MSPGRGPLGPRTGVPATPARGNPGNGRVRVAPPGTVRVGVVSTYPPRACGIGTFSRDLREALLLADSIAAVDLVAIVRDDDVDQAPEVVARIHQDERGDYAAAANVLERRGDDVVVIQHEYGIFGGHDGAHILSLAAELRQPIVLTLHTVLSAPSIRQAETLRALCDLAALVCVFTETARRMILDARLVSPERIRVVPHGGPTALLPESRPGDPPRGPHRAGTPPIERDRDRPVRPGDVRADLAGQGDRDGDRGDAGDRRAPPGGAVRDRGADPSRGGQAPRRGVPDLARASCARPRPRRSRRLRRPLPGPRGPVVDARGDDDLPHAVPLARADRVRRPDVRDRGRLPDRVDAVLLRRGPPGVRSGRPRPLRRSRGPRGRGHGPARRPRAPGSGARRGARGRTRAGLAAGRPADRRRPAGGGGTRPAHRRPSSAAGHAAAGARLAPADHGRRRRHRPARRRPRPAARLRVLHRRHRPPGDRRRRHGPDHRRRGPTTGCSRAA